jgi:hypothetical protein
MATPGLPPLDDDSLSFVTVVTGAGVLGCKAGIGTDTAGAGTGGACIEGIAGLMMLGFAVVVADGAGIVAFFGFTLGSKVVVVVVATGDVVAMTDAPTGEVVSGASWAGGNVTTAAEGAEAVAGAFAGAEMG